MLQNHFEEIYQYLHLAKQATGDLHNFNITQTESITTRT